MLAYHSRFSGIAAKNLLGRDHSAQWILGPYTKPDKKTPEHNPSQDIHGLVIVAGGALHHTQGAKYHHNQLQPI